MKQFLLLLCLVPASAFLTSHHPPATGPNRPSLPPLFVEKGTVKWFDNVKGFGFITNDADGEDVFVHQTAIQAEGFRALEDGASVEFDVETTADGKTRAVRVTGPDGAPLARGYAYKKRDEE